MRGFNHERFGLKEAYIFSLNFTGRIVALVGITMAAGVVTWAWAPIKFQADMGILLTFMFLWNLLGALVLIPALSHFLLKTDADRNSQATDKSVPPAVAATPPSQDQREDSLNMSAVVFKVLWDGLRNFFRRLFRSRIRSRQPWIEATPMMDGNTTREAAKRAMMEGSTFLETRNHELALESFRRAADLYGQLGDRQRQADGLNMAGSILARTERADEALAAFSEVIDLLGEEPKSRVRAMAWSNRGLLLARQKRFEDALGCFEKALALFQQGDEPIRVAEQWGNIGSVCRDLEQPDRAIENYQQALAIYRELDHKERIGDQYTNIAYARIMQQKSVDALRWYREALSYYATAGSESKSLSTKDNIDTLEAALGIIRCSTC